MSPEELFHVSTLDLMTTTLNVLLVSDMQGPTRTQLQRLSTDGLPAGIDSAMCPRPLRVEASRRLAKNLDQQVLSLATRMIGLNEAIEVAPRFLPGQVRGLLVVDVK